MKAVLCLLLLFQLCLLPNGAQANPLLGQSFASQSNSGRSGAVPLSPREAAWLAAHPVIRVGMDADYAPYEWIDPHGRRVGMAVDLLQLLETRLGVRFEILREKSWSEALGMAKRNELEMLTSIVKTPERSSYLVFTKPYRETQTVIIDAGYGDFIGTLARLNGKRVSVERGYFMQELLSKDYPEIELIPADSTLAALNLVIEGKAEAYVGDSGTANHAIRKHELQDLLRFSGQSEYTSSQSFGVTKANIELASILDKAMATVTDEEINSIINRWIGLRIEQGVKAELVFRYASFAMLLLALFAYWVFRLRGEVSHRKAAEMRERSRSGAMEMLASGAPLVRILETIVGGVEKENPACVCSILLLDSSGRRFAQAIGPSLPAFYNSALQGLEIGLGVGSCGTAAFSGERVIVEDIANHPYWSDYKGLAARAGLGACWSLPIRASSHQVLGTFAVYHREVHAPTASEIELIEQFAQLASIAIEKSMALQKLSDNEAHFRLLIEDVSDVIWRADSQLRITYINPVDERLRGFKAEEVIGTHVFEMFTAEGIATVKSLMMQRQESERQGLRTGPVTFEIQHRCKDGRLLWAEVLSKPERDAEGRIIGYHGISRETTERKRLQDQIRQLAFYDPLTSLPNRRLLQDRLSQAVAASRRNRCHGAVLFLDLDNFKPLNDTHGHDAGDLLLIEVANRITSCVREMDTVARFGGDEFVVIISELDTESEVSRQEADRVARKILSRLSEPYRLTVQLEGQTPRTVEHRCTASIGVALFVGEGADRDDILKSADAAMYQAKEGGRNRVCFAEMSTDFAARPSQDHLPRHV